MLAHNSARYDGSELIDFIDHLNTLTHIVELDASNRNLCDMDMLELIRATNLRSLNLANNFFSIDGFNALTQLSELRNLNVSTNFIDDQKSGLFIHSNIISLNIENNSIGHRPFPKTKSLKSLSLGFKPLTFSRYMRFQLIIDDELDKEKLAFISLKHLTLTCNYEIDSLTKIILLLTRLTSLNLKLEHASKTDALVKLTQLNSLTKLSIDPLFDVPPLFSNTYLLHFAGKIDETLSFSPKQQHDLEVGIYRLKKQIDSRRYKLDLNFVFAVTLFINAQKNPKYPTLPWDLVLLIFQYAASDLSQSKKQIARMCTLVKENLNRRDNKVDKYWQQNLIWKGKNLLSLKIHPLRQPSSASMFQQ